MDIWVLLEAVVSYCTIVPKFGGGSSIADLTKTAATVSGRHFPTPTKTDKKIAEQTKSVIRQNPFWVKNRSVQNPFWQNPDPDKIRPQTKSGHRQNPASDKIRPQTKSGPRQNPAPDKIRPQTKSGQRQYPALDKIRPQTKSGPRQNPLFH